MKKFLFSLAAVAMAFTSFASAPKFGFAQSELELNPGETYEIVIQATECDETVKGGQMQFLFHNPAGEDVEGLTFEQYGNPFAGYYYVEGLGVFDLLNVNVSSGISPDSESGMRIILSNSTTNTVLLPEATMAEYGYPLPQDVMSFKFTLPADWADEYLTIDFDTDYAVYSCESGSYKAKDDVEGQAFNIKVKNASYVAPPDEPIDLTGEIVFGEVTEAGIVTVDYTGDEAVTLVATVNGEEAAIVDGAIQLPDYGTYTIVVTASAEGYNDLTAEAAVEWVETTPPGVTEAPVISYEVGDEVVTVTATGAGTVILYIDGVEANNPYTVARGEEDFTIVATATAQEEGKDISEVTTQEIVVPALEEVGPVDPTDPHNVGYWVVFIDVNGEENWYELHEGANGDYVTSLTLTYIPFGTFNPEFEEERPLVPCYVVINGVRYGADEDMTAVILGNANENPLTENENCYTLPVGFQYSVGVCIFETTGEFGFYVAQGAMTGVDEVNAGKTVANVRYFNMAGQEMTEANGMTIQVTTYTDGTTSAVKVMK